MTLHPRNLLLALVLAALVAANVLLAPDVRRARTGGPLVAPFDAADVARIEIAAGDGEPVVLERADGAWSVATRDGFPAFAYAVEDLLGALARLTRGDRVGAEPDTHALFGVGAAGTRITLTDPAGRALAAVVQGAPPGLATGSYVRRAAADDVVRAPTFPPVGTTAGAWLDTRLVDLKPAEVRKASISHEGGRVFLDLLRDEQGWRDLSPPEPADVPRTRVERVLQIASTLVFSDVLPDPLTPEQGFGSPPETLIELELVNGERRAIWIGLPIADRERSYYATNPEWEEPWVVALPAATAEVLFAAIEELAGR